MCDEMDTRWKIIQRKGDVGEHDRAVYSRARGSWTSARNSDEIKSDIVHAKIDLDLLARLECRKT